MGEKVVLQRVRGLVRRGLLSRRRARALLRVHRLLAAEKVSGKKTPWWRLAAYDRVLVRLIAADVDLEAALRVWMREALEVVAIFHLWWALLLLMWLEGGRAEWRVWAYLAGSASLAAFLAGGLVYAWGWLGLRRMSKLLE